MPVIDFYCRIVCRQNSFKISKIDPGLMKQLVSPKQVARAIGVSESSLKRWCDQGLLPTVRTAGGHRRLPISGVLVFLRQNGRSLVDPALLGLPASSGRTERVIDRSRDEMSRALLDGDESLCRRIVFDLWIAGHSLSRICDQVIAGAFTAIGEMWSCHEADVYQERRACEITTRVLHELRQGLPAGDREWKALGGTIEGDQYMLPTTMIELILRDGGWQAVSLGTSLPFDSLAAAIRENRPRLFWVSVSYISEPELFVRQFAKLNAAADETGAAIVVGGYALREEIRRQLRYSAFCDSMQHLEQFARTLRGGGQPAEDALPGAPRAIPE
jgi:MerR family transcriptional regulator, light-induced transcriptional regulator